MELKEYLRVVRKRIWLIASIVLLVSIVTGLASYFYMKPVYEASTKLVVSRANDHSAVQPLDLNSVNMSLRLIDSYKEIIRTLAIMDKVVEKHPEFNLTAQQLIGKTRVSAVNNSQMMTITIQDASQQQAAEIVNAVSKIFQEQIPAIYKLDNVVILDEAKVLANPVPVKPNPKLNIAIAFLVSLMAAVGIAFLLEYLDDTIKTEDDVRQYLELPTLTVIMTVTEETSKPQRAKAGLSQQEAGEKPYVTTNT